jgi:hypothetical protein
MRITNWNIRRLGVEDGFADLEQSLKKTGARLRIDHWDVLCLQEPGNLVLPPTHLQYKCKRHAGWGTSIIVSEHYCNRVVFNACGKNWVLIGFNFDDLGWPGIGIFSAHLPPQKRKRYLNDAHYRGTLAEIDVDILALRKEIPGFRPSEGVDANVELPNLNDAVFTLTGPICNNNQKHFFASAGLLGTSS